MSMLTSAARWDPSMAYEEGIVKPRRPNAVERSIPVITHNLVQSVADSASANPPSSRPMPSDLMGVELFISSTSSSSDIQPSDMFGVASARY
jgi:hypothetical protein